MEPNDASAVGYETITPIGFSYYLNASSLSPAFYQTLLDRSWRRSGKLLYRPNQRNSCCPHYTIRLDSTEFKPSRTQRQTLNRFNKFVLGDEYARQSARLYPKTKDEAKRRDNEFVLVDRVHEAEYDRVKTPPEPAHKLVITLEEDSFTEEKHRVFDNYQRVVHDDSAENRTRKAFTRFLCSSPLRRQTVLGPLGQKTLLGSYHQCYRLDGKLVAVGVIDLLPQCVSSVYFFYDESIHTHVPGKLGALHEIALAEEGGYRWWYPGFYIHNCPKMRYKIDYTPQYILDPEALVWDPLDQSMLSLLDQKPYVSLRQERSNQPDVHKGEPAEMKVGEPEEESDEVSLFDAGMPGIPSWAELEGVDLDNIALKIFPFGPPLKTSDLKHWDVGTSTPYKGLKASIAEMVAALGCDTVDSICIDFSRHG